VNDIFVVLQRLTFIQKPKPAIFLEHFMQQMGDLESGLTPLIENKL